MAMTVQTFNGAGSDCSGSSGDANRVLTLSNTQLTAQAGFLVYVSGLALALTTEYTVSHNSSGTQITFVNRLWDNMTIVVQYFETATTSTSYSKKRTDIQSIISDHGKSYTLKRPSETTGPMGEVKTVTETSYSIIAMIQDITRNDRQIHEMGLAIPGNSKIFFYHEYTNEITGNGTVDAQVGDKIQDADGNTWRIEQIVNKHISDGYEIYRTGIIKRINLDEE